VSIETTTYRPWPGMRPRRWQVTVTRDRTETARPEAAAASASEDDRELVGACLRGHREAFDVIVERHQRQVYQLCYRFAGNHEDASDLAQDVFIRAYRGLGRFKRQSSLGTWLYRIGVNVCLNRVAIKTPKPAPLDHDEVLAGNEESPSDALLRGERAKQVRAAIARLPDKQRATLVLRVYHELPHEQIAGILGSSVGAVKANFFHALKNLKKLLHDQ
jgi:RNA polymerase sigma-70 factor, ECF subfamily